MDYEVAPPRAPRAPAAQGTAAILVVHGMGQQLQFQTLNDLAEGLLDASVRRRGGRGEARARAVDVGDERLQRLELTLSAGGNSREVHLYEAYWAPLTEGQVTLRDVMTFLFNAGVRGLAHSFRPFRRFINQRVQTFPVPLRTPLFLLTALLATVALVVVNAAVVGIPALRAPFHTAPAWASDRLFSELTVVLDVFVMASLAFIGILAVSYAVRGAAASRPVRARRERSKAVNRAVSTPCSLCGWLSVTAFVLLIAVTLSAGITIPLVVSYHVAAGQAESTAPLLLQLVFPAAWLSAIADVSDWILIRVLFAGVSVVIALAAIKIVRGAVEPFIRARKVTHVGLTLIVLVAFAAVIAAPVWVGVRLVHEIGVHPGADAIVSWRRGLAWPLTIVVSLLARRFLVQFVGDVAAYIQPQELDRFNQLRDRIKDCVWKTAKAVYASGEAYQEIIVVGHSLGSVVAYDVLNRLYREEALGRVAGVRRRTGLFLSFGSPLDKTAFLFAIQGRNAIGRDALAASVQPFIAFPHERPPWVNIFSPWDIISGSLDFYDDERDTSSRVKNVIDPDACVWLGAHTEYWNGKVLFDTLHSQLV